MEAQGRNQAQPSVDLLRGSGNQAKGARPPTLHPPSVLPRGQGWGRGQQSKSEGASEIQAGQAASFGAMVLFHLLTPLTPTSLQVKTISIFKVSSQMMI